MSEVAFLLPAFLACLVLTGIHTYLGIHVIRREVIFLDIALAQIAAVGITVSHVWHFEPDSTVAYIFALAFTAIAAVLFTFLKSRKVPQEAIIGVVFAVSSALGILIADRLPHGGEHIKYVLSGTILWVSWPLIIKTTIIYFVIGFFHYIYRRQFLRISSDAEEAAEKGVRVWWWDLLFYMTFGAVITSSVQMGGILLVFSFLIVPALCSLLFFESIRARVLLGWSIGALVSGLGIAASYTWDLPTGPTIVTGFGLALLLCFVLKPLLNSVRP